MTADSFPTSQLAVLAPASERSEGADAKPATQEFIVQMLERLDSAEVRAENLQRALQHSRDIGAAIGILMARHKLTQEQAFAALRRVSQDSNRKLYSIAQNVIETRELPRGRP